MELKPRTRRQGKCFGAALEYQDTANSQATMAEAEPQSHTYISNDIWFHLANYIAPEDVQRFALICSQSANTVNSCRFWLQLYRRYCQHSTKNSRKWILQLPSNLQMENILGCDKNTLRQRVIQSLFYCYTPFKERLTHSYQLETLVGRTYLSSWHKQVQCIWIMCYKFRINFPLTMAHNQKSHTHLDSDNNHINADDVVNDWETLAEESNNNMVISSNTSHTTNATIATTNDLDGVSLLVICCDRFIPFPSDIVYNYATCPFRLAATRELLSTDMRSINLELDFISSTRDQTITVKYAKIQKYKVVPWWHPDFRILNKCE